MIPGATAGSRSLKGRRGHWTFHTASAGYSTMIGKEEDHPQPLSAPWQVNASRIRLIEDAISNFGDSEKGVSTGLEAQDRDASKKIINHRVVEACMETCWACAEYAQAVINPSFIGCCSKPKYHSHAEHICSECIDEINRQLGDQTERRDPEPGVSSSGPEDDSGG